MYKCTDYCGEFSDFHLACHKSVVSPLQRRAAMYEQSSQKVLNYFIETGRLVTVDVTCGVAELIWHQVHHVFCDLEFQPQRTVNTILLFAFGIGDIRNVIFFCASLSNVYIQYNAVQYNNVFLERYLRDVQECWQQYIILNSSVLRRRLRRPVSVIW